MTASTTSASTAPDDLQPPGAPEHHDLGESDDEDVVSNNNSDGPGDDDDDRFGPRGVPAENALIAIANNLPPADMSACATDPAITGHHHASTISPRSIFCVYPFCSATSDFQQRTPRCTGHRA